MWVDILCHLMNLRWCIYLCKNVLEQSQKDLIYAKPCFSMREFFAIKSLDNHCHLLWVRWSLTCVNMTILWANLNHPNLPSNQTTITNIILLVTLESNDLPIVPKSTKNLLNVRNVVEITNAWLAERQLIKRRRICEKLIRKAGLLIKLPNPQILPLMPTMPNNKYHPLQPLLPNQLKILQLVTKPMQLFLLKILKRRRCIGPLWHVFKKNVLNALNCLNG